MSLELVALIAVPLVVMVSVFVGLLALIKREDPAARAAPHSSRTFVQRQRVRRYWIAAIVCNALVSFGYLGLYVFDRENVYQLVIALLFGVSAVLFVVGMIRQPPDDALPASRE